MIKADDVSATGSRQAAFKSESRTAADLDNSVSGFDIQQINGPDIAFSVGRPLGHDPAGDASQKSVGISELGKDDLAKAHDFAAAGYDRN
jgi:hypothetical protein